MGGSPRHYTQIQNDRVLRDIIGGRLLSVRELAVAAYVWRHSWGMRGRERTQPGVRISGPESIAEWTGMARRTIQRTISDMLAKRILIRHDDGGFEFNEHFNSWAPAAAKVSAPAAAKVSAPKCGQSIRTSAAKVSAPLHICNTEKLERRTRTSAKTKIAGDQISPAPTPKNHARDPVWDAFAARYQVAYGSPPTRATRHFVNLARLRKTHPDEILIQRVEWLFSWRPTWLQARWSFDDLIKHIDKIPNPNSPNEVSNGKPESATDRYLRECREREHAQKPAWD